jgi:histone H3/H4
MAGKSEKRDLVVKSAVRELVKDMRVSDSFFDGLNKAVEELVKRAVERAKANGRSTLRDCDV